MIEMVIEPRARDLGGFHVKRILPFVKRKTVGPFIFVDQMGPETLPPGKALEVRPHPHIGLSTVTYLFQGRILHRDSLGVVQEIIPGEVNWMTAGHGIVHSERSTEEDKKKGMTLYGMQTWVALPKKFEDVDPSFHHHKSSELPKFEVNCVSLKLILGKAYGHVSPVKTYSELFYLDAQIKCGRNLVWPKTRMESAVYIVEGELQISNQIFYPGQLVVFEQNKDVSIYASKDSRFMILGGEPLEGPREIYWNLVSSSKDKIEKAKTRWRNQEFPKIPGETDFIPLPQDT